MNPVSLPLPPLRRAAALVLLGALALGGTAGCSTAADSVPRTPQEQAQESSPTGTPTSASTATDVGWVQLMTPMNQQAVKLLTLAAARAAEPRVRDFAVRLRTGQEAELNRLRALLTRMGLPGTDVHAGHDMPGMVTVQGPGGGPRRRGVRVRPARPRTDPGPSAAVRAGVALGDHLGPPGRRP